MRTCIQAGVLATVLSHGGWVAAAQQGSAAEATAGSGGCSATHVSLLEVIDKVGARLKKKFLVDPRVAGCVYDELIDVEKMSYEEFQAALALHGYVDGMQLDGVIRIVPDANARQLPLRLIDDRTREVGEHEMVMKIIDPAPLTAQSLVPILRPLLSQYSHLVSDPQTNSMILVARYGNVRTVEALVSAMRARPVVASASLESGAPKPGQVAPGK
jgi:type II secretory pathway component GspD/PulD (secretin)